MEMELLTLLGLLLVLALGLALVGVPLVWLRSRELVRRVDRLEAQLASRGQDEPLAAIDRPEAVFVTESPGRSSADPDPTLSKLERVAQRAALQRDQARASHVPADPETDPVSAAATEPQPELEPSASSYPGLDSVSQSYAQSEPQEPTALGKLMTRLMAVNLTARIGALLLILGTIFLGKYASDIGFLTLPAKLSLMGLVSLLLAATGIYYADRLKQYGEILQGTGLAGWLITWFLAHVLYDLTGWVLTLIAAVLGALVVGYRALKQNAQSLAVLAYLGAFLAPFIASSEVQSLWRLFAYMLLLNGAVILTAWHRPWRWLVREAYVSSFGLLGGLMLAEQLQHDLQQPTTWMPMALFNSLLLMGFSVLSWRWLRSQQLQWLKQTSGLLFAIPTAAALAYQGLFHEQSLWVAGALVLMALWYSLLAWFSRIGYFWAIALVLASMAIPFAVSDSLTSLAYSVEGAAFVYWAARYNKGSGLIWGLLVQLAAALFAVKLFDSALVRDTALQLSWWLHGGIVLAALGSAWSLFRAQQPFAKQARWFELGLLAWALGWLLYHWAFWLAERYSQHLTLWYWLWLPPLLSILVLAGQRHLAWRNLLLSLPILTLMFLAVAATYLLHYANSAPILELLLVASLAAGLFGLRWFQARTAGRLLLWDALLVWFGLPLLTSIALYHSPLIHTDWNLVLALLVPIGLMLCLQKNMRLLFPAQPARPLIRWASLGLLFMATLATFGQLGNYAPMPFWPVLHPLVLLAMAAAEIFYRHTRRAMALRIGLALWLGTVLTIELNRWLFHYVGVQFNLKAWLDSGLTQTVWALVWSLLGALLMVSGARWRASQNMWLTGAALLAVVVLKLFVLDLAQVDTLFRILSFIGVGALLLAVGYFAPMPSTAAAPGVVGEA